MQNNISYDHHLTKKFLSFNFRKIINCILIFIIFNEKKKQTIQNNKPFLEYKIRQQQN